MRAIKVYLAGDSTVQSYGEKDAPQAGWGQYLNVFFENTVEVVNRAIGGRSSRSYIEEKRLEGIESEIGEGDYLFVQFGHNDADSSKKERYVEKGDFSKWLMQYIEVARQKGAIPVLITPIAMKRFSIEGICEVSFNDYRQEMIALAKREDVIWIDLGVKSAAYFTKIGEKKAEDLFMEDNVHLKQQGAKELARLVIQGIDENKLILKKYLKK